MAKQPRGELTLREAFAATLLNNPTLASRSWEVRVREARALQAGLMPNPELGVELEEFAGTGDTAGLDAAETTVLFSQLIELGQKRRKRTRVAALDQDLAAWDYESARVAVLAETASAFIETLALQKRLALAKKNLSLAEQALDTIRKRVEAGATSPLDQTKAKVAVSNTRIDVRHIQRQLKAARLSLAAMWGGREARFDRVSGNFEAVQPLPELGTIYALITDNPEVARWAVEIARREHQVELERSRAIPDVTAGVGVKHLSDPSETAAVVQFSLPLPIHDRNQGDVLASRYALAKARQDRRATDLRVHKAVGQAYQRVAAAHEMVAALQSDVLPGATEAYEGVRTAYAQGKIGYLDVLDAQRTLFETRSRIVAARASYHRSTVDLERLIGRSIANAQRQPTTDPPSNKQHTPAKEQTP